MKLLLIGGTRFSGRALTGLALERGHDVTVFHRGTGDEDPWPDAEHVHGDRGEGFGALAGRAFDAVADMCGYVPRELRASCSAFPEAGLYAFASSLSVHRDDARPDATEDDDVYGPPFPDSEEIREDTYGPLKVASEVAVRDAFGDRALVVRPGLIVGPHDPTDRFTYWPRRIAAGGTVLAPAPRESPVQFIDARDLGAWIVHATEWALGGTYNATGEPTTFERLLETCKRVAGSAAEIRWVPGERLVQAGVGEWMELPLWIAS